MLRRIILTLAASIIATTAADADSKPNAAGLSPSGLPSLRKANLPGRDRRARAASRRAPGCLPMAQWTWSGAERAPAYPATCVTPLVVQLTDDDLDGQLTCSDTPDVVFTHFEGIHLNAHLTAIDGASGADLWTAAEFDVLHSALAAADLDGDGRVEILAVDYLSGEMLAFDVGGNLVIRGATSPAGLRGSARLTVADLDQDGAPELFVGESIFNSDLSFRCAGLGGLGGDPLTRLSIAADLDPARPGLELLAGNTLYDANCAIIWRNLAVADLYSAIGDIDGDGDPEIFASGFEAAEFNAYLLDGTGTILDIVPLGLASAPAMGDLDGDGDAEIFVTVAFPLPARSIALAWNGTELVELWSVPTLDYSGFTTGVIYDINGDGAADVIYNDEQAWYIFNGPDGAIISELPLASDTLLEAPVVADIDGDGVTEILIASCAVAFTPRANSNRVVAFECSGAPTARAIWNQFAYHVDNVTTDGAIPTHEQAPWLGHNSWLGQVPLDPLDPACARPPASAGSASSSSSKPTKPGKRQRPAIDQGVRRY